jgi:rhodanese-related sulfurtransferase
LKFYLACRMNERCHLVYALAPPGTTARDANELLNEYVAERDRGLAVWHDHFIGDHGGAVVLDVRSPEEVVRLEEPGPLEGWQIAVHPLTFALTAVGFEAQIEFTLERYRDVRLEELADAEPDDPRYWWKRRNR